MFSLQKNINVNITKEHNCEEKYCSYYKAYVNLNQNCNIQTCNLDMLYNFVIFFYDLETVQTIEISLVKAHSDETQFLHEPILLCSQQVCNLCWKIDDVNKQCKQQLGHAIVPRKRSFAQSKSAANLFTRECHHQNISVIFITQNIFHQGQYARDISLNCSHLCIMNNPLYRSQFQYLARQL